MQVGDLPAPPTVLPDVDGREQSSKTGASEQQKEDEKYRGDQEDEGAHVPGTPTALADPLSPCGSTNQLQRGLIVRATR